MTALIAVGLIALTGVVIWALSWVVTWLVDWLDRGRRAPRFERIAVEEPFQHPALPPMAEDDVAGTHDWDGWLQELAAQEPKPTLREEQIEIEGEPQ